jgi:hypothetical protein
MATLSEALEARWRDDDQSLAWHVQAPVAMLAMLHKAKVPLDDVLSRANVLTTHGPKATKAEIRAYLATVTGDVPKQLLDAWSTVGPATWSVDGTEYRFLGPREIVARRTELRAKTRKSLRSLYPDIDVIATIDGEPEVLMAPGNVRDGEHWFHYASGETYQVLTYMISVRMILPFHRMIRARVLDIFHLEVGKKANASKRAHLAKGKRCWDALVDGKTTAIRTGTLGTYADATVETHATPAAATSAYDAAVAKAKKLGYT